MNDENRKILEHLVEYLQDKINTGYHKIFYNDDMYDEKTIDCINAINDTLEENERLNKENTILKQTMSNNSLLINENAFLKERIDKAIEYIEERKNLNWYAEGVFVYELLNILQGVDKE